MNEGDATAKARAAIKLWCRNAKIYKHNDRQTKGIPDTSVSWAGLTTWLEFKMLEGNENIHVGGGARFVKQLVECIKLEQQARAWVIAYRKGTRTQEDALTIYRPTALYNKQEPQARELSSYENMLRDLKVFGVARFEGFNHEAVGRLINETHGSY